MDTQTARTRLEQSLADLDRTAAALQDEEAGRSSELSTVTQHPGDVGTQVSDSDRETALLEAGAAQRAEVVAALQRLDEGTYGRCVDCGEQIADERLEARPEVARCLQDQQKDEASR